MKFKNIFWSVVKPRALGAPDANELGYENPELLNSIKEKTLNYVCQIQSGLVGAESFRIIAAIGLMQGKKQLSILDFGGSYGAHQAVAKKLFAQTNFFWIVVETPGLIGTLSDFEKRNGIHFCSSIKEAESLTSKIDLVIANASIHYTTDPLKKLSEIVGLGAEYIFITRTPLTHDFGSKRISQDSKLSSNGPGITMKYDSKIYVKYPAVIVNKDDFESILLAQYSIIATFVEESVTFTQSGEKFQTYGYFCKKSKSLKLV